MIVVGLTGGISCGKTTVSRMFSDRGVTVVDLDALARRLTNKGTSTFKRIVAEFGDEIVEKNTGELDRAKLGAIIFNDATKRRKLNSLTHKAILMETLKTLFRLFMKGIPLVILDSPLLIETGLHKFMNCVVVISVAPEIQLERLMERDKVDEELAKAKINSQMDLKKKCEIADYIIDNSTSLKHTEEQVEELLPKLQRKKPWITRDRIAIVLVVLFCLVFYFCIYSCGGG